MVVFVKAAPSLAEEKEGTSECSLSSARSLREAAAARDEEQCALRRGKERVSEREKEQHRFSLFFLFSKSEATSTRKLAVTLLSSMNSFPSETEGLIADRSKLSLESHPVRHSHGRAAHPLGPAPVARGVAGEVAFARRTAD